MCTGTRRITTLRQYGENMLCKVLVWVYQEDCVLYFWWLLCHTLSTNADVYCVNESLYSLIIRGLWMSTYDSVCRGFKFYHLMSGCAVTNHISFHDIISGHLHTYTSVVIRFVIITWPLGELMGFWCLQTMPGNKLPQCCFKWGFCFLA